MRAWGEQVFGNNQRLLQLVCEASEYLCSCDTLQFKDYARVVADRFDPEKKARRRKEVFPLDCDKAVAMGAGSARAQDIDTISPGWGPKKKMRLPWRHYLPDIN